MESAQKKKQEKRPLVRKNGRPCKANPACHAAEGLWVTDDGWWGVSTGLSAGIIRGPRDEEINMQNAGYLIGWVAFSLLNAGLARKKRRSGLRWWLISLLLGPAATLVIVILPKVGFSEARPLLHDGGGNAVLNRAA